MKNPPAMQETWVQTLGWEDPLGKGKATHSSILAWRIPWKESARSAGDLGLIPELGGFLEKGKATQTSILAWRIPWTV